MSPCKHLLLASYYYAGLPWRRREAARRSVEGTSPVMILFYHRVADTVSNPWSMSTGQFAEQIHWMRRHFDMISLAEAQLRLRTGWNERPAVAVTFDDGYYDNYQSALPLLIEWKIPVTYFVSTQFVLENRPFPHDVAAGQPLRPNTLHQLQMLVEAGVELGAHTRTHADLGKVVDHHLLYDELVSARDELEDAVGTRLRYFAFPYGQPWNMTPQAVAMAKRAGYAGICSAYGGYNLPCDEMPADKGFHLRRIHGDPEMIRLKNWLTVDPRKLRNPRLCPFDEAVANLADTAEPSLFEASAL